MSLQAVVLEKTPEGPVQIGDPYPVELASIEEYVSVWKLGQPQGAPADAVKVTGVWKGWTILRIACHPDSRWPIAWRGVKEIS